MHDQASDHSTIGLALKACQKQIDDKLDQISLEAKQGTTTNASRNLLYLFYRSFNALEHAQRVLEKPNRPTLINSSDFSASDLEEKVARFRRVGLRPPSKG